MSARDVLKNFHLMIDGRGYAGQVEEYTPPVLNLQVEDFRGGGMDSPVSVTMGMEKLETSFSLVSYDQYVLALWGVQQGKEIPMTVKGALESYDGTVKGVTHSMRGKIRSMDSGTWQAGQKPSLKITMDLNYYKLEHSGQVIHEVDVINMVRTINGIDVLAETRGVLGL
ncbi:MAG: phage major tail tube protein [Candidatus Margulisiibacteriota bacterium]